MIATTRAEATDPGGPRVWDLADASREHRTRHRRLDARGPFAAALGGVALGAALTPGLPMDTRWYLVVSAGALALLVAVSALRRQQALLSLLLAVTGLIAPLVAGAVSVDLAMSAPSRVTSTVMPDAALPQEALVESRSFASLPTVGRAAAQTFITGLVVQLRTLHGASGPYPASLACSNGRVVEGVGALQGAELGTVPVGYRLEYGVAASGTAFRVSLVSTDDPEVRVTAENALVLPERS